MLIAIVVFLLAVIIWIHRSSYVSYVPSTGPPVIVKINNLTGKACVTKFSSELFNNPKSEYPMPLDCM